MSRSQSGPKGRLFPALLKYWRGLRGMSQLDLAFAAEVSARHVSFLETGRAGPSEEMVLRLAAHLAVPLKDQNAMLRAAGFVEAFPGPSFDQELGTPISAALDRMFSLHEPFPMLAVNRRYDILRMNRAAETLSALIIDDPSALTLPVNIYRLLIDPKLARGAIVDWPQIGRAMLSRLHLESLQRPEDEELRALVEDLFRYPGVPEDWRQPDFSLPNDAVYSFRLKKGAYEFAFLTTVTVFSAPGNITLEDLQIESYYPLDEATEDVCRKLAAS